MRRKLLSAAVVVACLGIAAVPPASSLSSSPPLSASSVSADAALSERSWRLRTAVSTLQGIKCRDGGRSSSSGGEKKKKLSLLHDFHDPDTGLCGEGVWHNSMLGIALVKASRRLSEDGADAEITDDAATTEEEGEIIDAGKAAAAKKLAEDYRSWARRLATNLFELNYVSGKGFRRRSSSGIWGVAGADGNDEDEDAAEEDGEFYEPSRDRRSVSNAAAVLFLTYLREDFPDDAEVIGMSDECSDVFFAEFFDKKTGRFRYEAGMEEDAIWRSSDQAMGILTCLRLMRGMKDRVNDGSLPRRKLVETRTMAAAAAEKLMDDFDFGPYATEGLITPVNTVGASSSDRVPRRRNSWHDSLACFAILASNATSGRESPVGLCKFMARDYGIVSNEEEGEGVDDGSGKEADSADPNEAGRRRLLLAHDVQENRFRDGPNAYTCTQAIWDACRRAVDTDIAGFGDFTAGLQSLHERSSVKEKDGGALATVGTSYPMVRLWANTELAAFLLIDPADFAI